MNEHIEDILVGGRAMTKSERLNKELDYYKREKELYRYYQQEVPRLSNIINKAIEYMERYMFSQKENYDYIHLLDILKEEEK